MDFAQTTALEKSDDTRRDASARDGTRYGVDQRQQFCNLCT